MRLLTLSILGFVLTLFVSGVGVSGHLTFHPFPENRFEPAGDAGTTTVADAQATRPGWFWGATISRDEFVPLTPSQRWSLYWRQTFLSPGVYVRTFALAGYHQWRKTPEAWGTGGDAYLKRVGDQFGRFAVESSIEAVGAAILNHDVRYVRSDRQAFWPRLGHALAMSVLTLDRRGRYVPAVARMGGAVGSEFIRNSWLPDNYRSTAETLGDAGFILVWKGVGNVVREFWPRGGSR